MASRTVSVALVADVGAFQSSMVKAAATTRTVGESADVASAKARRGFEAAGRGAALLGAVAAGGLVLGLKSAVSAASDAEQSIGGVEAVFKGYANSVIASSKEADRALGLSANSYRELATIIGSQMKNAGVPLDQLADKTEGIIGIGADLAAQFGGSTQEAVEALSSAFRGELDPIERYGISLTAAAVGAKAVEMGLAESETGLSQNAKAMATLAIVTEQSADAQGAFGRESDTAAGRAQRAAAQWENLKVAVGDRLLPAWSALVDVLGTEVIPFMGDVLDVGGDVVNFMMDNKEVALALAGVLAVELAGGIGAVTVAFNSMILTPVVLGLSNLLGIVGNLPAALAAARTAVAGFITAATPLVAVGAVVYGVTRLVEFASAAGDARDEIAGMWDAVNDSRGGEQLTALSDVVEQFRAKVASLRDDLASTDDVGLWDSLLFGSTNAMAMNVIEDRQALDEYEAALRKAEAAQDQAIGTARILGNQFGLNRDQVLELADRYNIDLTQGTENAYLQFQRFYTSEYGQGPMNSTHALRDAMATLADVTSTAEERIDALQSALDILGGKTVSVFEAQSALQQVVQSAASAMEGLTGAVLDGNGHLNAYTESGQRAGDILIGIRDKGNELITTMVEQGATIEEVRAADANLRQSFIDSAMQMGISREAAEALANEILGVPTDRETRFTAATDQAAAKIAALQAQIDAVARDRTANINFRATMPDLNGSASGSGRMGTFAGGGYTGPGHKYKPAGIVHAGEVVWSQDDVAAHGGVGAVESMRRSRRGYAGGGVVLAGSANTDGVNAGLNAVDARLASAIDATARYLEPATRAAGALNWARSQVGKPYLWGGVGPGGYDCSGFMSAITNYMRGRPLHSRVGSTASFPWAGFQNGYGMFTIGSTPNAGDGIGHMAGTVMGVNVESAGGVGVRVGAGARGASNGLFSTRAHLATFDQGGPLQPGYTLAYNGTGRTEWVSREMPGSGAAPVVNVAAPSLEGLSISGRLALDSDGFVNLVDGRIVSALNAGTDRGRHNG